MVLSVSHVPHTRWMISDRRTGRNLLAAFLLARMALLVLVRRASVNVSSLRHDEELRGLLVFCQDDDHSEHQRIAGGQIGSPPVPVEVQDGRLLDVRQVGSASATQTTSSTLVLTGLIALLGVTGAATFLGKSIAAPVRRVVHLPQAPEGGGPTLAGVGSTDAEQVPGMPAVAAGVREIAPGLAETRSVVPVIAQVVREAQLAFDATIAGARARGADEGLAPTATAALEPAQEAAKATATAANSLSRTRYAAARSRALGPTTALWHAVKLQPMADAVGGACETTVCGSLVRVSADQPWPVAARDICPACDTLAH